MPWRGYFAAIRSVDRIVMYDSQQFTRRDWRNRNLISAGNEPIWLTLSVKTKGKFLAPIREIEVSGPDSIPNLINTLQQEYRSYAKNEGFEMAMEILHSAARFSFLSDINLFLTEKICDYLQMSTEITSDVGITLMGDPNDKLIQVCKHFEIYEYFTGPSAESYIIESRFNENEISVSYFNYSNLPPIDLPWEPSIIHWIATKSRAEVLELTRFQKSP